MLVVTLLQAATTFIKRRFPSNAALVESNWCYIQPLVDTAIYRAQSAAAGTTSIADNVALKILADAVREFKSTYAKFEGKPASVKEIDAVHAEIADVIQRTIRG